MTHSIYKGLTFVFAYSYKKIFMTKVTSLIPIKKKLQMLEYTHNGNPYKIFIPIRRGPSKYLSITDKYNKDVMDNVRVYLGPNEDFHGFNKITPELMGFEELSFVLSSDDNKTYTFTKYEIIQLPRYDDVLGWVYPYSHLGSTGAPVR